MDGRERHGPYDRPIISQESNIEDDLCPFCRWPAEKWWPQIRAPLESGGLRPWHLKCAETSLDEASSPSGRPALEPTFGKSLIELLKLSKSALYARKPAGRVSVEEERVSQLALEGNIPSWPLEALAPVPVALFHLAGILELRLSGSCNLTELPPEIGGCQQLETLSLIGNSLSAIPAEVGMLTELRYLYLNGNFLRSLPEAVCDLPKLREICLDANCLEEAPHFSSSSLILYTAPGNKFPGIAFSHQLERLEVHGNQIRNIIPLNPGMASQLVTLKVMGNQLTELPEEVSLMPMLRILSVAHNRLRSLPQQLSQLQELEWLLAYENCITALPPNLGPGCRTLTRLLLETNPLTPFALADLISDLSRSRIKTLGLDTQQVSMAVEALPNWEPLPSAVSVGTVIPVSGCSQISAKLTRASQLRRDGLRSVAEPMGPPDPANAPAALLVVAFTASQGEPEWLGFLRRLLELGEVKPCGEPGGTLEELIKDADSDFDVKMSRLWSNCPVDAAALMKEAKTIQTPSILLEDFDVLTVVDHRMRWYNEDRPALEKVLKDLRPKYSKMLFVGASMGGFGALLHGGSIADGVVAFNPQVTLTQALLRPPAETLKDLEDLSQAVMDSVQSAQGRAQITVHCAADEHLSHALALPSGIRLVLHPLQPRKPFARILDRAQLLIPIVSDAVFRLLGGHDDSQHATTVLGCWCRNGSLKYINAEPSQLFRLFFGPGSAFIPRPGDWFCGSCQARNCKDRYFCWRCQPPSPITNPGTVKVLDSFNYPSQWDWGCTNCGAAMCGYQWRCSNCGAERPGSVWREPQPN